MAAIKIAKIVILYIIHAYALSCSLETEFHDSFIYPVLLEALPLVQMDKIKTSYQGKTIEHFRYRKIN